MIILSSFKSDKESAKKIYDRSIENSEINMFYHDKLEQTGKMSQFDKLEQNDKMDQNGKLEKNSKLGKTDKLMQIAGSAGIPALEIAFQSEDSLLCHPNEGRVFQAASLSKPLFAYIVLKMAERGEIDLDLPIHFYTQISRVDNMEWAEMLTARSILSHKSGLQNWATSPSSDEWPLSVAKFRFRPDSAFSYSGEGYYLLQQAVEKIKGKPLDEIAREEVFIPLNMINSSYEWMERYDSIALEGFNRKGENRGKGRHPRANSAYTLRTTASDYSKFLSALINGSLLSPQTLKTMLTPDVKAFRYSDRIRDCDNYIFWGLGLGVERNSEFGEIFFHWGDNGNFKALFVIIPSLKSHLVYFTNSECGHDIIDDIVSLFFRNSEPLKLSAWINE